MYMFVRYIYLILKRRREERIDDDGIQVRLSLSLFSVHHAFYYMAFKLLCPVYCRLDHISELWIVYPLFLEFLDFDHFRYYFRMFEMGFEDVYRFWENLVCKYWVFYFRIFFGDQVASHMWRIIYGSPTLVILQKEKEKRDGLAIYRNLRRKYVIRERETFRFLKSQRFVTLQFANTFSYSCLFFCVNSNVCNSFPFSSSFFFSYSYGRLCLFFFSTSSSLIVSRYIPYLFGRYYTT